MFDSSDQGQTERDLTDQGNDAMREGVKALVLMNGGGAVALLAFLQAIWQKDLALSSWIIGALTCLGLGLGAAGLVHLLRVHTSEASQEAFHLSKATFSSLEATKEFDRAKAKVLSRQRTHFVCAYASLILFLAGIGLVVYGAARSLAAPSPSYPMF